jgi:hypothetical protein
MWPWTSRTFVPLYIVSPHFLARHCASSGKMGLPGGEVSGLG